MKYILNKRKIMKKYEEEIKKTLEGEKYHIQKIESFADFPDSLGIFHEIAVLLNTAVSPISFSECETRNKLLGVNVLSHHKTLYDNAKYKWVRKHCTEEQISFEEDLEMIHEIQKATLPFGSFTIAFKCHRMENNTVKSRYSGNEICFAPLLYDIVELNSGVFDFFCNILANKIYNIQQKNNEYDEWHQMNIYVDNILTIKDIDNIYPLITKLMQKYNEYVATLYHAYKNDSLYQHRDDIP